MTGIRHKWTSPAADGTDATKLQPSNWNDDHVTTGQVVAIWDGGGAGVTRVAAEVLMGGVPRACVTAVVVEVLLSDATPAPGGGGTPSTHTYGYAV
jgi:hypothetical protein